MASTERDALAQAGPEAVAVVVEAAEAQSAPDLLPAERLQEGLSSLSCEALVRRLDAGGEGGAAARLQRAVEAGDVKAALILLALAREQQGRTDGSKAESDGAPSLAVATPVPEPEPEPEPEKEAGAAAAALSLAERET